MTQPSQISIKEDRIIARFRTEADAQNLVSRMPKACQTGQLGNMHAVAFDTRGLNVEQLTTLLQLSEATLPSTLPKLHDAVIIGNTREALNGLRELSQPGENTHAMSMARASGRTPSAHSL